MSDLEQLAFEASQRSLDKQERVLEELRARTGVLLAASSLAASFLGQAAFADDPPLWLAILALVGFLGSVAGGVFILTPRQGFVFATSGPALYEELYAFRDDIAEVHRRLAYDLARFWDDNDVVIGRLVWAYRLAVTALVVEVIALVAMVSDSIL